MKQLFDTGLHVEKISNRAAKILLAKHHYMKGLSNSAQSFGAFINGELVGVVCFGVPCSENVRASLFGKEYKESVRELSRLCLEPNCPVPASSIVSKSIAALQEYRSSHKMSPIHGIISFADTGAGHFGGVYQAMSWLYTGTSRSIINVYTDQEGRIRHQRQNGVNISSAAAEERGWITKKERSIKHRYIKLLGSRTQRKYFRSRLLFEVLPYPKNIEKVI